MATRDSIHKWIKNTTYEKDYNLSLYACFYLHKIITNSILRCFPIVVDCRLSHILSPRKRSRILRLH